MEWHNPTCFSSALSYRMVPESRIGITAVWSELSAFPLPMFSLVSGTINLSNTISRGPSTIRAEDDSLRSVSALGECFPNDVYSTVL